jgi:hypothetical protein
VPQGITYNPCPEDCGGRTLLKNKTARAFNSVEQNGNLKILIGYVWGNGRLGRGVSCLPITVDYEKGY